MVLTILQYTGQLPPFPPANNFALPKLSMVSGAEAVIYFCILWSMMQVLDSLLLDSLRLPVQ